MISSCMHQPFSSAFLTSFWYFLSFASLLRSFKVVLLSFEASWAIFVALQVLSFFINHQSQILPHLKILRVNLFQLDFASFKTLEEENHYLYLTVHHPLGFFKNQPLKFNHLPSKFCVNLMKSKKSFFF